MNLAGAVLTGGASRRMGRTKALIEVDGRTMADRAADALRSAGVDDVAFIGGDAAALTALTAPIVADGFPGEGPVGGVLTALAHFNRADRVVVLACDVPFLNAEIISSLLAQTAGHVVVAKAAALEPMCAVWSRTALAPIRDAFDAGERALHRVISGLDHVTVDVDAGALININTPEDLPR